MEGVIFVQLQKKIDIVRGSNYIYNIPVIKENRFQTKIFSKIIYIGPG